MAQRATYIFKHALTREVVYDSILSKRKKQLHEEIGNTIVDLYKENINEHCVVLAEHFIKAENYKKGAEYSRLAERKAEKSASINDAIAYAKKRITCLEKLPVTDDVQKEIIDARTNLGLYAIQFGQYVEGKEAVDPIVDLAPQYDNKKRLALINIIVGSHGWVVEEDFPNAFKRLKETLIIGEDIKDTVSIYFANYQLGMAYTFNCEFKKAIYHLANALNINEAVNNLWGISVVKSSMAYNYFHEGKIDLGYQNSNEAIQFAEESGDIFSKVWAYSAHGCSCYAKGFFEEAIKTLQIGNDYSDKINNTFFSATIQTCWGITCFDIAKYQESINHCFKAIQAWEKNGSYPSYIICNKLSAVKAQAMKGEKNVDISSLLDYVSKNRLRILDGLMRRYIGEILLNIDDLHMNEAQDWIQKAIKADERNGTMWHLGRDYALYADLFKRKGDQSNAKENLKKAIEILKECGADGWVERYEKELATLS